MARKPTGGKNGRPHGSKKTAGGRERMRALVDDEARWAKFIAAVDKDLADGRPDSFLKAFEHGYGRPPQALDVTATGNLNVAFVVDAAEAVTVEDALESGE